MKKQNLRLCLAFFVCMLSQNNYAYDAKVNGVYYNFSDTEATVTYQYRGISDNKDAYKDNVTIPETVDYEGKTYFVTSIGEWAFYGCSGLTAVTIPNSVTGIGGYAFQGCTGLTNISIPNSVTDIGIQAFYRCSNLTSITIPSSVTTIGGSAFAYCSNLSSLTIYSTLETIGNNAFRECNKLTSAIFHCKEIRGWLSGLTSLSNVVIGNEVEIIDGAFRGCTGLTEITIPSSVTTIGYDAFQSCTGLTEITIPSSVTTIGYDAFWGCTGLTEITIPSSVTDIDEFAFENCTNLSSISIPESLSSIGRGAFEKTAWYNNQPDGMIYIGKVAYRYKGKMPTNTELIIKEGTLGIAGGALNGCSELTSILIPNTVVTIGNGAFDACSKLKEIEIPNSVKTLGGSRTFYSCKNLTKVIIPNCEIIMVIYSSNFCPFEFCDKLESVSFDCRNLPTLFYSAPPLKYVVLGDHVETIGESVFAGCRQITQLTIGKSVSEIKENAFAGIQKLDEVICYAENVPKTDRTVFANSFIEYATLYVPASSVEAYKSSAPWSGFKQILPVKSDTPDDAERCATPTIIYKDRNLSFECATDGVTFVTDITDTDIKKHYTATIPLTATYNISVYASKKGYKDSEITTATLCWIDAEPTMEDVLTNVANIQARAVLIQSSSNTFTIEGAEAGTAISVYDTSGKLVGSANARDESATTINTSLRNGDIGIVKIGDKSVKVAIK